MTKKEKEIQKALGLINTYVLTLYIRRMGEHGWYPAIMAGTVFPTFVTLDARSASDAKVIVQKVIDTGRGWSKITTIEDNTGDTANGVNRSNKTNIRKHIITETQMASPKTGVLIYSYSEGFR